MADKNEIKCPHAKYCQLDSLFLDAAGGKKQSCPTLCQWAIDPSVEKILPLKTIR